MNERYQSKLQGTKDITVTVCTGGTYQGMLWRQCGLMVKAWGWQSFDSQFGPYLRAFMVAPVLCGTVAWDAGPEPMV
jgi:hypothetical protein